MDSPSIIHTILSLEDRKHYRSAIPKRTKDTILVLQAFNNSLEHCLDVGRVCYFSGVRGSVVRSILFKLHTDGMASFESRQYVTLSNRKMSGLVYTLNERGIKYREELEALEVELKNTVPARVNSVFSLASYLDISTTTEDQNENISK